MTGSCSSLVERTKRSSRESPKDDLGLDLQSILAEWPPPQKHFFKLSVSKVEIEKPELNSEYLSYSARGATATPVPTTLQHYTSALKLIVRTLYRIRILTEIPEWHWQDFVS